jgi:hypothetical protein
LFQHCRSEGSHKQGQTNNELQRRWTFEQPLTDKVQASNPRVLSTGTAIEHEILGREQSHRPLLVRRNTTGADGYVGQNDDRKVDSNQQQQVLTDVELTEGKTDELTDSVGANNVKAS